MKHLILVSLFFLPLQLTAQEIQNNLSLTVDALAFFRDNEYSSQITKGYTLPGTWIRPAVSYEPNKNIHLEAGLHALFFDGANKYPNYAYHDIGTWKGSQYQSGAHVLPWFRAEARMQNLTVILGNIYGGVEHRMITPLYNREQLMSADPEMGVQLLWKKDRTHVDAFVNWQSYQFKEDTHQEAFTVGLIARSPISTHLSANLTVLSQHRGGEQEKQEFDRGVQTLCNGAIGLEWHKQLNTSVNSYGLQLNLLGSYQQAGRLWPFDGGFALHGECELTFAKYVTLRLGCLYAPKQFISLYGNPMFSTISIKSPYTTFNGIRTGYLGFDYQYSFGEQYTLGAEFEAFRVKSTNLKEFNVSFGIYLRVCPRFILSK